MNAIRHVFFRGCIVLLGVSILLVPCHALATISYTWVDQPMYCAGEDNPYDMDLNSDGLLDFIFVSTCPIFYFIAHPQNDNPVVGGYHVAALSLGFLIDSDLTSWGTSSHVELNSCAVVPGVGMIATGNFLKTNAFMGVRFCDLDGLAHYGWIRIDNPTGSAGGTIVDFAYETEPGVGILAGAGVIPEPATVVLMLVASVGLGFSRLRTKRRKRRPNWLWMSMS